MISGENWAYISDITPKSVNDYICKARGSGVSVRKINSNILSLRGFCTWMTKQGYMVENPIKGIKKLKVGSDLKVKRRALSELEITWVLQINSRSNTHHGLDSECRALVYELALTTGLRYNEIKTLERMDFDLTHGTVTVQGKNSKNGHTSTLLLKEVAWSKLKVYLSSRPALPHAQAFMGMQSGAGAKMLKTDLAFAGVDYENEYGKADFHSLRHTFCAMLAKSGVQPQVAQRLMRHSSIDLTMNFYTHILIKDKASAISQLPDFIVSESVKNGTDDATLEVTQKEGYKKGCIRGKNRAELAKIGDFEGAHNRGDLGVKKADNSIFNNELTAFNIGTCSRIRTVDLLIKSQLL